MTQANAIKQNQPRWKPNPKIDWHFDIDIVGGCNLRCPSCPMGNMEDIRNAKGYMKPELLDKIIRKAKSECGDVTVGLFNWTEPFLHPNLAKMIRIVNSQDVPCMISTNLNIIKKLDDVLSANPKKLRISLSGFTQEKYGFTHQRGDIEVVKHNMIKLAEAKERVGSSTTISVAFHRYLDNYEDEVAMRDYAESLGFKFDPLWAYLMPLEKVLAYVGSPIVETKLTDEDRKVIKKFALPVDEALQVSKKLRSQPCALRDHQMALTVTGDVLLCCATYDQSKYSLASYLDTPLEELQDLKYRQDICGSCMSNGIHVMFVYGTDELDKIARKNVLKHYPDANLLPTKKLRRGRKKSKSRLVRKIVKTSNRIKHRVLSTGI